jgi:hypothetical protein
MFFGLCNAYSAAKSQLGIISLHTLRENSLLGGAALQRCDKASKIPPTKFLFREAAQSVLSHEDYLS